jgi:hypothetical protein
MAFTLALRQIVCEIRGIELPLNLIALMQMSEERCELAFDVYEKYQPTSNVLVSLQLENNTEENEQDLDLENA